MQIQKHKCSMKIYNDTKKLRMTPTGSRLSFQGDCNSDPKISAGQCQARMTDIGVQQLELDTVSRSAPSDRAASNMYMRYIVTKANVSTFLSTSTTNKAL